MDELNKVLYVESHLVTTSWVPNLTKDCIFALHEAAAGIPCLPNLGASRWSERHHDIKPVLLIHSRGELGQGRAKVGLAFSGPIRLGVLSRD